MFNQNDLGFAQERLHNLKSQADQARRIKRSRRITTPLWVRALSVVLDQSRWMLVEKSDLARGRSPEMAIRLTSHRSSRADNVR